MRFKAGSLNEGVNLDERGDGSKKLDADTKTLVRTQRGTLTPQQATDLVTGGASGVSAKSLTQRLQRRLSKGKP